jgi:hypothetical protein
MKYRFKKKGNESRKTMWKRKRTSKRREKETRESNGEGHDKVAFMCENIIKKSILCKINIC